jgi:hypothetical protein
MTVTSQRHYHYARGVPTRHPHEEDNSPLRARDSTRDVLLIQKPGESRRVIRMMKALRCGTAE